MKQLFPDTFTLPELQCVYETILEKKLDRRNFRKKLLSDEIIVETNETLKEENKKTTKLYKFTNKISTISFYK